jgi:hypothetical protein
MQSTSIHLRLAVAGALLLTLGAATAHAASLVRTLTVVSSGEIPAFSGMQTRGTVNCPRGTVPFGGGAFAGEGTSVSINGSFPSGRGWTVDLNNASPLTSFVDVRVVCSRKPSLYSLASDGFGALPAGRTTTAFATCPAGSFPLGGGSDSSSSQVLVNLNASFPTGQSWRVDESNLSATDAAVSGVATCGAPRGYVTESNGPILLSPHTETLLAAGCPGHRLAVGGGVIGNAAAGITVNSTAPDGIFWDNEVNNTTGVTVSATAWVVCVNAAASIAAG